MTDPAAPADDTPPALVEMPLGRLLTFWRPGSHEWTWADEHADLIDDARTAAVAQRIDAEGFGFIDYVAPVMLGSDGRVWDGHHRIVLAIERGATSLMVDVVTPSRAEPASAAGFRRHPEPVKPSREDVARAIHAAHMPTTGVTPPWERESEAWRRTYLDFADAALALWPGRSAAEVKAEERREVAKALRGVAGGPVRAFLDVAEWLECGNPSHALTTATPEDTDA